VADEKNFWIERGIKASIVVIALGVILAIVHHFTADTRREMPPVLKALSEDVSQEFADAIPRNRDVNELLVLVLQRGNRDEESRFKEMLKDKIKDQGKYKVSDWADVKKAFGDTFWGKIVREIPGMQPGDDPQNIAQAKKALSILATTGKHIDGVLLVTVSDFTEGDNGYKARVTCEGEIYSVDQQKTIDTIKPVTESVDSRLNYLYLHHAIASSTLIGRVVVWFLVAATLPFVLIQLVRGVVSKRRNELNLTLVVGFTLFDVFLGWVLLTSISLDLGAALVVALLVASMGYYNYDACDYIERRLT
jgi:hypothetical protein